MDFLRGLQAERRVVGSESRVHGQATSNRDRALLLLILQTGEFGYQKLINICLQDVELDAGAHIRCTWEGS